MQTKLFEIRDEATFIVALAIKLGSYPQSEAERYLLSRAGNGMTTEEHEKHVILTSNIAGGRIMKCIQDFYDWGDRTYRVAHAYIIANWDDLDSGAVVDVQFILGETVKPKQSESVHYGV